MELNAGTHAHTHRHRFAHTLNQRALGAIIKTAVKMIQAPGLLVCKVRLTSNTAAILNPKPRDTPIRRDTYTHMNPPPAHHQHKK